MKFQRIGPTGLLRVGTMMTIGGMTNGRRAVMVNGEFRRHGGTMVSGWYCDGYGYTWQQGPVQSAEPSASHDNRSDVQKTGSVGSMIINPLLFDMTCETTGGLRFVHEHEFADMETENRLVVDCKDFESELADTGCVLARGCDSCTRESEEEDELADMGCVLARSCDSCTHESEEKDELTDMCCVLAKGCDSCTHESEEVEAADMGCVLARGCDRLYS